MARYLIREEQIRRCWANDIKAFLIAFSNFRFDLDFLRQMVEKLSKEDRKKLEDDLVLSATVVRVLTPEYLANALLYIQSGLVEYNKFELEQRHAIRKFKYRLTVKLKTESFWCDGSGKYKKKEEFERLILF